MNKKKILFVNDEMVVGGVSKVLNNLLGKLDQSKYDIDLLVLHKHGEMLKDIPEGINVISGSNFFEVVDQSIGQLIKTRQYNLVLKKVKMYLLIKSNLIKKAIQKQRRLMNLKEYDVEIAFKEGFCSLFVLSGNTKNKINWIHVDYMVQNYSKNYMWTMRKELSNFNHHIAVSNVAKESYQKLFELDHKKVIAIHNIIDDTSILKKAEENIVFRDEDFAFLTIGRMHSQKALDRLVIIANNLKQKGLKFKIYIIGDGELKAEIEKLIIDLNVKNEIILLYNQSNPFKYLKQADAFVLPSLYEGLPTVVFESLILNVPVLSVEVAGVKEQLQDKFGEVVDNNIESLESLMEKTLRNKDYLSAYKSNLINYKYDNNKIIREIERLF